MRNSQQTENLRLLIDRASSILITSHISPDPDAVCSSLLLSGTLKVNYPDKNITLVLEEEPNRDLSFLSGYQDIKFQRLVEIIPQIRPQLLIIVDANKFDRVARRDALAIEDYIRLNDVKTAVIDHHEPHDLANVDVYINNQYPASCQEVYNLCFSQWRLSKPDGYAQTTLLGIVTDTFRFKYKNPRHRETFALVSDLADAGADIEELDNRLEHYEPAELKAVAELASNFSSAEGYNYSFVSDEFMDSWRKHNSAADLKSAIEMFTNQFLRNTGKNKWGFVVNQEVEDAGTYHVSLRAIGSAMDVSAIASRLGGGGHKPAAGAKFAVKSLEEALAKVKQAIQQVG